MDAICNSQYDISDYLNINQKSISVKMMGSICTAQECRQAECELGSIVDWKCEAFELLNAATKVQSLDWHELYSAMQCALSMLVTIRAKSELEQKFEMLTEQWRVETAAFSSAQMIAMHPAYQRIIGMGSAVIPLILRELSRKVDHWFWALSSITGENPVDIEDAGNLAKMTESWLILGRKRGWI